MKPTGLELHEIRSVHVEGYVEVYADRLPAVGRRRQLAAIRTLFDYLVEARVVRVNPVG